MLPLDASGILEYCSSSEDDADDDEYNTALLR